MGLTSRVVCGSVLGVILASCGDDSTESDKPKPPGEDAAVSVAPPSATTASAPQTVGSQSVTADAGGVLSAEDTASPPSGTDSVSLPVATTDAQATSSASVGVPSSSIDPARVPYPSLPIPIAFVGFTDTSGGVVDFAGPTEFTDCPRGIVLDTRSQMTEQPLWGECVAARMTAELNDAFGELLATDQVLFESIGYSAVEAPEFALFDTRDAAEYALPEMSQLYGQQGVLVGFVSNWLNGGGGFAPRDQALDAEHGVGFVFSQGMLEAVIHEVGHVMGLLHSDEDLLGTGELSYDVCGPMSAPVLADCNCEFNIMEASSGEGRCPNCPPKKASLVTPTHGAFFRDVVDCWLTKRRFLGQEIGCTMAGVADCLGYENAPLDCTCVNTDTTFELSSCDNPPQEELNAVLDTCGVEGQPIDEVMCESYAGYPGVDCQFQGDGSGLCQCRDGAGEFATSGDCTEITQQQIYDTCLGQAVTEQCSGTSADDQINCVTTADGAFNCLCQNSGVLFGGSSGTTCDTYDLDDLATNCTLPF